MTTTVLIPLFPLPIVVCPGEFVPLHIFEERYKQLLAHVQRSTPPRPFGISLQSDGRVRDVGCSVRLLQITREHPDGRADIIAVGLRRFRIEGEQESEDPWDWAKISYFDDQESEPADPRLQDRAIALYLDVHATAKAAHPAPDFDRERSIAFQIASAVDLKASFKQSLIENRDENNRLQRLINHLHYSLKRLKSRKKAQKLSRSNGNPGH